MLRTKLSAASPIEVYMHLIDDHQTLPVRIHIKAYSLAASDISSCRLTMDTISFTLVHLTCTSLSIRLGVINCTLHLLWIALLLKVSLATTFCHRCIACEEKSGFGILFQLERINIVITGYITLII